MPSKNEDWEEVRGVPGAESCILLLHGLNSTPKTVAAVADMIFEQLPSSYVLVPKLPFAWNACVDLDDLAREVLRKLRAVLSAHSYRRVLLVGHSAGGVLAQTIYLLSWKEDPLQGARLVLIAPLSRGRQLSHHLPLGKKLSWSVGLLLIPLIGLWERLRSLVALRKARPLWITQLRRSSPFLVGMRLSWLAVRREHSDVDHEVVQLLGSTDELVSWRDTVDTAIGSNTVYLEVPFSDHVSILDLEDAENGGLRKEALALALGELREIQSSKFAIEPWDTDPIPPNPEVRRVVFVIHGIRDEGHWTQKIAIRSKQEYVSRGHTRDQIEAVTSSYGYFSMLQFLLYPQRLAKVNWLAEEYVEARRRFPSAKFSYIGHSNGTYLAAHAVERFPLMEFDRLAFAGSVVSSKFQWDLYKKQVGHVLNYAATTDWVVGIFPRIADLLPLRNLFGPSLGGAGIEGFPDSESVKTFRFRKGAHAAAIEEKNWPNLARFAVMEDEDLAAFLETKSDPDNYQDERFSLFRKHSGPITCVVGWLTSLGILAVALPLVAWNKPAYLWVATIPPLIGVALAFTLAELASRSAPLQKKKETEKALTAVFLGAAAILSVWLLWGTPFRDLLASWNQQREAVRTASLLGYLWCVYRLLTRV